jgi:hypothetical protein
MSKVKKVAIISIQSNKSIYGVNLKGERFSYLTGAATMIEGQKEGGNPFISQLLQKAKEQFTKQLDMLPGKYMVISGAAVTNHPAYQEFAKNQYKHFGGDLGKGLQKFSNQQLDGYMMIHMAERYSGLKDKSPQKQALAKLAQDLGVDAVALIDLDVYYKVTAEILGSGSADAAVNTLVLVYGKDAEDVMSGSIPTQRQGPLGMIAGNVFLDKNTYPIFEKAVVKSFTKMGEMAAKDLSKQK